MILLWNLFLRLHAIRKSYTKGRYLSQVTPSSNMEPPEFSFLLLLRSFEVILCLLRPDYCF